MAINNDILNNVDNIGSIGTQLDLFDNSVFIPVGKLDADQYAVDDIDGVTESLFGSGNMNFLSLQAAQTNEYLASLAGSSDQPSFNDTDAPAFFQNASILEGAATSLGIQTPSSTRGSYFSNGEDSSLDAGRPLGGENHESHAYAGNADAGPDVTSTAKASASSFYNPTPLLNDTLGADNGLNGNNGGSGTVQIVTTGLNGNDGSNGSDGQDGGGGGGGDTLIDIDIDLGDTLGDVINNTVNEVSDLLTTIVNNAGDIVTNVTDILGDTINNVTDILTTIINGVLGDDGLHIGLNLDVIDTVLGNLSLDIGDTISGALNAGLDLAPLTDVLNNLTDLGLPILADLDLGLNFDIDPSNIMLNLGDINDLGSLIDTVDDLLNPYINLDVADTSEVTDVVSGVLDNLGLGDNSLLDAVIQLANDALDPVDSIVNTVEDLVQDPLATVSGLLDDPQGTLTDLVGDITGSLGELNDLPGDINNVLGNLDDGLGDLLSSDGNGLIDAVVQLAGDALTPVGGVIDTATNLLQDPVGTLTDLAQDPQGALGDLAGNLLGDTAEGLGDIVPDIGNVVDAAADTLGDIVPGLDDNSLIDAVVQLTNDALDPVGGVIDTATDLLQDPVGTLTDLAQDPQGALTDLAGDLLGNTTGELDDIVPDIGNVTDALGDTVGDVGDALGGIVPGLGDNNLIDAVIQLANDTLDPVEGVVDTATDLLQDPVGTLTDLAQDPQGALDDLAGNIFDNLSELNDIAPDIGDVTDALDDSLGSVGDILGSALDLDINSVQNLLGGDSSASTQDSPLDSITSWTESIIPDGGGMFGDIVSGIGGEVDSLPEPITSLTEGLGSLVVDDNSHGLIGKLGGLFG